MSLPCLVLRVVEDGRLSGKEGLAQQGECELAGTCICLADWPEGARDEALELWQAVGPERDDVRCDV